MIKSVRYPNTRGASQRAPQKQHRCQTWQRVVSTCFSDMTIRCVIEHGMGFGTTYFHNCGELVRLVSFENVAVWKTCQFKKCSADFHKIFDFGESFERIAREQIGDDAALTLALIDGPARERPLVFESCTQIGLRVIVEHDAEVYSKQDLEHRRSWASDHGYAAWQYIGESPESAIFILGDVPSCAQQKQFVVL